MSRKWNTTNVAVESMWHPAANDPQPPLSPNDLASRLGVATGVVEQWLARGLPHDDSGSIDPFAADAWILAHGCDQAPLLQRRWRGFCAWLGALRDETHPRRYWYHRQHQLFLPTAVETCRWRLANAVEVPGVQRLEAWSTPRGQGWSMRCEADYYEWEGLLERTSARVQGSEMVRRFPQRVLEAGDPEWRALQPLCESVIADFRYGYRRHHGNESSASPLRWDGSCLDICLHLGARCAEAGRAWRLCGGVFAHSFWLNPHFWIEVACSEGRWAPVDASIPAIHRLLGDVEWRELAGWYCGGIEAGRIQLSRGHESWPEVPGHGFASTAVGDCQVWDAQAEGWCSAWACIDWACGVCEGTIVAYSP